MWAPNALLSRAKDLTNNLANTLMMDNEDEDDSEEEDEHEVRVAR
jgi:hypothetical protein